VLYQPTDSAAAVNASRLDSSSQAAIIVALMNKPVQCLFDFESGNMNGYENWRRQQEERLQAIRNEWGLPVRRRVRLRLKNIDGEFEGVLRLADHPLTVDSRLPLHLRIDNLDVFPDDIEQCVVIDDAQDNITPL